MAEPRQITIVGGGLAGLALGIGLRQREIPVLIWEAGTYPRHRVCGEFISGQGVKLLEELGLREKLARVGARTAESAAMVFGRRFYQHRLPTTALCISRYTLDQLLADEFQRLGGILKTGSRFAAPVQPTEGHVRATGRSPQTLDNGWHWFGLKAHVRNVKLAADLEMHYSDNAYIGLCALERDLVNVCGLFRRRKNDPKPSREIPEMLQGKPGTLLHERLRHGDWVFESICTVAGLSFGPLAKSTDMACRAGDVFRMIPPLTGNGMSIAFESAGIALQPLENFARGSICWQDTERSITQRYFDTFRSRFWWANLLQKLAFSPAARACSPLFCSETAFRFCFFKTR
jgi:flavin-dependent dehydrogenase